MSSRLLAWTRCRTGFSGLGRFVFFGFGFVLRVLIGDVCRLGIRLRLIVCSLHCGLISWVSSLDGSLLIPALLRAPAQRWGWQAHRLTGSIQPIKQGVQAQAQSSHPQSHPMGNTHPPPSTVSHPERRSPCSLPTHPRVQSPRSRHLRSLRVLHHQ